DNNAGRTRASAGESRLPAATPSALAAPEAFDVDITLSIAATAPTAGSPAACERFLTHPPSSMSTATTAVSRISRPSIDRCRIPPSGGSQYSDWFSGPIAVQVQLATGHRQRRAVDKVKQRTVDSLDQGRQLTLVRRLDDEHAACFSRWEPAIVQIV